MNRMAQVIRLRPDSALRYKRLHEHVWPEVASALSAANLRNYSIFLREPEFLLFATWEYHGVDFAADMAAMRTQPRVEEWWQLCAPLQEPLETVESAEWWAPAAAIFHLD